jgi:ABC-type transporter Mla MlaB component
MEPLPKAPQTECEAGLRLGPDGLARVAFKGRLSALAVVDCWNKLERNLRGAGVKKLKVDVSGVDFCGGAGFALLPYLNMAKMTLGAEVSLMAWQRLLRKEEIKALRPGNCTLGVV